MFLPGRIFTYSETSLSTGADFKSRVSENLTWSNMISVRETVMYVPDESSSEPGHERTKFEQEARITALCGGWQRMKAKIEEATVDRFKENAKRGREGFEAVLEMSRRAFGEEKEMMENQRRQEHAES